MVPIWVDEINNIIYEVSTIEENHNALKRDNNKCA